ELAKAISTTPQLAQNALRGRGAGARGIGPILNPQTGRAQATPQAGRAQSTPQAGRAQSTPQSFFGQGARGTPVGRGAMTAAGQAASAQGGGGIVAVASKSTQTSIRLYNGKDKYNEWVFMAIAAT